MAHGNAIEPLVSPEPACERQRAYDLRLDLAIRVFLGGIGEAD